MSLPRITHTLYETILPSTNKKIKYRAFTVKEEKIMLIAKESRDSEQITLAIKQILTNCLIDVDIDSLAIFDVEYMLNAIRSKSVGNIVEFVILDPETEEEVKLTMDLDKVVISKSPEHTNKIKVNDEYTLFMRYPNYDTYLVTFKNEKPQDPLMYYDTMLSCFDRLVSKDAVYKFSDFSKEEVDQFVEDLDPGVMEKLRDFFKTMPIMRHEIKYKNKAGNDKTFVIEGTDSFFI